MRSEHADSGPMNTGSEPDELFLHPSPMFALIYAVASFVLAGLGAFAVSVAPSLAQRIVGWTCVLFFGAITLSFLVQCAMPSQFGVKLDSTGFTVRMNVGSRRYRWTEVDRFFLFHTVAIYPVVAFRYRGTPEVHGLQWTRGLWGGFDGTLPQTLTLRGGSLLNLMEGWRLRLGGSR